MKKVIFTALVAVVAIGAAFQGNASSSRRLVNAGILNASTCNIPVNCTPAPGTPCTLTDGTQVYLKASGPTGKCSIFLSRN